MLKWGYGVSQVTRNHQKHAQSTYLDEYLWCEKNLVKLGLLPLRPQADRQWGSRRGTVRCALGWVGAVIELGVHNASPGNHRFTNSKLSLQRWSFVFLCERVWIVR